MRRALALLHKELSQHGAVGAGLAAFLALSFGLCLLGTYAAPQTITMLEAHALFVRVFVPLAALVLGHRLVVREYHAKTQRFLEALPLRRSEVVLEKLLLGALLLGGLAACSLLVSLAFAAAREPLTVRWALAIFVRTEVFVLTLWALLFAMGLLGRFRVPLYVALAVAVYALDRATEFEFMRFGPAALVGNRFVLERLTPGWTDVAVSLGLAAGFVLAGLTLALGAEGALAEAMARAMSRREKAAASILAAGGLIVTTLTPPAAVAPPFAFAGEGAVSRGETHVQWLGEGGAAAAGALAEALDADRRQLCEVLGAARCPALHVADHPRWRAIAPRRVGLSDEDYAVLMRARLSVPEADRDALRVAALAALIDRVTGGRAELEAHEWVRRGLAHTLVFADAPPARVLGRARWVGRFRRPSYAALTRFHSMQERFGEAPADAVAGVVGASLARAVGAPRWRAFARRALGSEPPLALTAPFVAWRSPPARALAEELSLTPADVEGRWAEATSEAAISTPRVTARLSVEEGVPSAVRWSLRFEGPPEDGARCAFLHAPLGPFDVRMDGEAAPTLAREERGCVAVTEGSLVGRYGPGERAFFALEVWSPSLGAWLRVHAERRVMR